ncbi:hypothetical protein AVEN_151573-1 [Araneus ventricosus]|uniref:Reverse transcriptase/retrotransposon-derived protein RNase H-like domain-containing protein n=1 Tax=Araneus ventricosus TaxID=182803 RepID=A0A4Y2HYS5_ARAVE|nr:hypothetical protein AVEN_151573-1 [Araneus ventricosus]
MPLTKRVLLSIKQRIFDPIGFTAPVTLIPKLLLQKTWSLKLGGDEPLPNDLCCEYRKWAEDIGCLEQCRLSRHLPINSSSTLHVFCDTSQFAFSCCIFLRTEVEGKIQISVIAGKARVQKYLLYLVWN